jgi:hypothetical protein
VLREADSDMEISFVHRLSSGISGSLYKNKEFHCLRLKTISKVRELFMLMDGSTLVMHAQGTRHQIQTLKTEISDMLKFGRFQGTA